MEKFKWGVFAAVVALVTAMTFHPEWTHAQYTPPSGGGSSGCSSLGGDVTGTCAANTVVKLQNRALASTAPSDTDTICWDAGGSTWKPCAASGGGASYGTCASLPMSVPSAGNQYICSDQPFTYISTGSAWVATIMGYAVTPPALADFTQVNVDKSTLVALPNAGFSWSMISAGGHDVQVLTTANGTGDYYVDACFIGFEGTAGTNGGFGSGLSSGTTTSSGFVFTALAGVSAALFHDGRYLYSSTSSYVDVQGAAYLDFFSPMRCTRVHDDGTTNRTFFMSATPNGPWVQVYQEPRTTTFIPTNAGIMATPYDIIFNFNVVHYLVHN